MIRNLAIVTSLWLAACGVAQAEITVSDAWVRASLPHQRATGAFMKITAGAHGAPLGAEEIAGARAAYGWNSPPFELPDDILAAWRAVFDAYGV